MVGHADGEMTVVKGEEFIHSFLEEVWLGTQSPMGKHQGRFKVEEGRGKSVKCPCCGFHGDKLI